jgi:hypothetical protein
MKNGWNGTQTNVAWAKKEAIEAFPYIKKEPEK